MNWIEARAAEERHKETLRKRERERFVRGVLAAREGRERFYSPGLRWLGGRLVTWGQRLQGGCAAVVDTSAARPPAWS
jgi:hypothetical protein